VREDRATKYKSIPKKNNILQSVIITVNKRGNSKVTVAIINLGELKSKPSYLVGAR